MLSKCYRCILTHLHSSPALCSLRYCNREFDDEKILIQHQKAKHFKCHICHKKLYTGPGLAIHCMQVHKETIDKIPNGLPNRNSVDIEIYGMEGIPEADIREHEKSKGAGYQEQAAAAAAAAASAVAALKPLQGGLLTATGSGIQSAAPGPGAIGTAAIPPPPGIPPTALNTAIPPPALPPHPAGIPFPPPRGVPLPGHLAHLPPPHHLPPHGPPPPIRPTAFINAKFPPPPIAPAVSNVPLPPGLPSGLVSSIPPPSGPPPATTPGAPFSMNLPRKPLFPSAASALLGQSSATSSSATLSSPAVISKPSSGPSSLVNSSSLNANDSVAASSATSVSSLLTLPLPLANSPRVPPPSSATARIMHPEEDLSIEEIRSRIPKYNIRQKLAP